MSTTATTELKHTPGPWTVSRYNDLQYSISCSVQGYAENGIPDDEDTANAKLIAAAPDMYDIIKELYDWSIRNNTKGPIFPKLEAVMNKINS